MSSNPVRSLTDHDVAVLRSMVSHATLGEMARKVGCSIAEAALAVADCLDPSSRQPKVRLPRGKGYTKADVARHRKAIERQGEPFATYARKVGLSPATLGDAFAHYEPDWWEAYKTSGQVQGTNCDYCGRWFVANRSDQRYCGPRCQATSKVDDSYFGGRRSAAVGMDSKTCQLCERTDVKGIQSHHALGKANDPDNRVLVALCAGCHKLVTLLGERNFTDEPGGWERLIELVWLRREGERGHLDQVVRAHLELEQVPLAVA